MDREEGRGEDMLTILVAYELEERHLAAIRERLNKVRSPFRSAEHFAVEDIIDPRDTRPLLCEFADLAWARQSAGRR